MKRTFDFLAALIGLTVLGIPLGLIALAIYPRRPALSLLLRTSRSAAAVAISSW